MMFTSAVFLVATVLLSTSAAPTSTRIIPVGPLSIAQLNNEFRLVPGVDCNGKQVMLAESGPVYDSAVPMENYELPILCQNGYSLATEHRDGWYLISGLRECVDGDSDAAKLNSLLEKFVPCELETAVCVEPTETMSIDYNYYSY